MSQSPEIDPLNKLCKWRVVFAGWLFGTRAMNTPGTRGMRDLAEKWLIMRTETNAVARLLIEKGIISAEEYTRYRDQEAALLDLDMERCFPGMRTTTEGVYFYDLVMANKTMKDLGFPP